MWQIFARILPAGLPWPAGPAFAQPVDAFLLHPSGDLVKSVETGSQSSLQRVHAGSTAGNRIKKGQQRFPFEFQLPRKFL